MIMRIVPEDHIVSCRDANEPILPVVFDSPHSGTICPPEFRSAAGDDLILETADLFVDELYEAAPDHGAALLCAEFPRIYVDPNRPNTDLDPKQVEGAWTTPLRPSHTAKRGIGVIWRLTPDRREIYAKPLSVGEIQHRLDQYWQCYHDRLLSLLELRRRKFGAVWHVDCHSMPGAGTKLMGDIGQPRADFIVGDRDGTTCASDFTEGVAELLRGKGYDVRINELFRGAEIVRRYGDPASGCHSVQIEINRSLYMDEQRCAKLDRFDRFRDEVIVPLIETVCGHAARDLTRQGMGHRPPYCVSAAE